MKIHSKSDEKARNALEFLQMSGPLIMFSANSGPLQPSAINVAPATSSGIAKRSQITSMVRTKCRSQTSFGPVSGPETAPRARLRRRFHLFPFSFAWKGGVERGSRCVGGGPGHVRHAPEEVEDDGPPEPAPAAHVHGYLQEPDA